MTWDDERRRVFRYLRNEGWLEKYNFIMRGKRVLPIGMEPPGHRPIADNDNRGDQ